MVPLMNYSDVTYIVKRHERIAQLVAITSGDLIFDKVDKLDLSDQMVVLVLQVKINFIISIIN